MFGVILIRPNVDLQAPPQQTMPYCKPWMNQDKVQEQWHRCYKGNIISWHFAVADNSNELRYVFPFKFIN